MTTDAAQSTASEPGFLLEQNKRLSDSLLWSINRRYYDANGPRAWHSGEVPSYATCNTYIAQAYAHVALTYLRDLETAGGLDDTQPIYIVELAAGVGRFAYQFLRKFHTLLRASSLRRHDVRYVMTDFTETNIETWAKHPALAGFVADKQLYFGRFDAERDTEVSLHGGGVLSASTVKNPIAVIANYAFDTFRHDLLRFAEGAVHEVTITTRSPHSPSPDLGSADVVQKLRVQYDNHRVGDDYYKDPILDRVVADYRDRLADVTISIPIGGLVGLRRLVEISGRRLLLLSSDKGFTHEDELYYPHQSSMQFHTGCFSMNVNYHAMGQWFVHQGGHYAATSRRHLNLKTAVCLIGGDAQQFADTLLAIEEKIELFGPGEFFELIHQQRPIREQINMEHFLGLLRMSHWDPGLVWDFAAQLRDAAEKLSESIALELRIALERAWQNYFPGPQNLAFELARIFMALKRPQDAIRFNKISLEWFGEQPATYLNMGIAHYYSEQPEEAQRCFASALQINPNFGIAKAWHLRLEAERVRGGGIPVSPGTPLSTGGGIPLAALAASVSSPVVVAHAAAHEAVSQATVDAIAARPDPRTDATVATVKAKAPRTAPAAAAAEPADAAAASEPAPDDAATRPPA